MDTNDIIGHGRQINMINAMLQRGTLPQVLIFSGLAGIGKRKIAIRLLADLADTHPSRVERGLHPDCIILSPNEKGTIPLGEDNEPGTVRQLINRLSSASGSGRYGVIIDGIENISLQGQNALLKTLEEPPENTLIIILTANKRLMLPTILSRASIVGFKELTKDEILQVLAGKGFEGTFAELVAEISGGSAELALLLLQDDNLSALLKFAAAAAAFVKDKTQPLPDSSPLEKTLGAERLVFLLTSCFRAMLMRGLNGKSTDIGEYGAEITTACAEAMIKLFLSIHKGLRVNILLGTAIKAGLYGIQI